MVKKKMVANKICKKSILRIAFGITVLAACLFTIAASAQTFNNTQSYSKNPKLESVLSQLIGSSNPQKFARDHALYMQDGSVRISVELVNETAMLPDYVVEETRYKKNVQVLVPIEKITSLSMETNVTFIRAPLKPYAESPTAVQTSLPKSGFNTSILFIFSIALIFIIKRIQSDKNVKK